MWENIVLINFTSSLLILIWVSIFLNSDLYIRLFHDVFVEPVAVFLASILGFCIWFYIIINHNTWWFEKEVIITIIWWLAFLKSCITLLFPKKIVKLAGRIKLNSNIMKLIWLIYVTLWLALSL